MNICIFCSAYVTDPNYVLPAKELANLLAKDGHHLVWGGSDTGLMHVIAEAFQQNGGKLYGVSIEAFADSSHKNADEMIIAKDLGARKAAMIAKSDIIVILPGGLGTLDELAETIELKKQGHHNKQVIVLNTDGFYDGLKNQLDRMEKEGFTPMPISNLVRFIDHPNEIVNHLQIVEKAANL